MCAAPALIDGHVVPTNLGDARRWLELASSVLGREGADPATARQLLRRAVFAVVQGGTPPEATVHQAVASLPDEALAKVGPSPADARTLLGRLDDDLSPADLRQIVASVEALVRARTQTADKRGDWWRSPRLTLAALALIATVLVPVFAYFRYPSDRYTWRASSAARGFAQSGYVGQIDTFALLVHTDYDVQPWIEIDLQKTRPVKRVIVRQRIECCQEQGIPMVVELAGEDKQWRTVGERGKKFDSWTLKFAPQTARWVRIRSTSRWTSLQLREIRID